MKRALAALALAGCATPPCEPGTAQEPGPACTTTEQAITVDGDDAEWAGLARVHTDYEPPGAGNVIDYQIALDGDALAVFLHTDGPPIPDAEGTYVVQFESLETQSPYHRGFGGVELSRAEARWTYSTEIVPGLPAEYAYGSAGVELRVPRALLPVGGAAVVIAWTNRDAFLIFPSNRARPVACWDPARRGPCG